VCLEECKALAPPKGTAEDYDENLEESSLMLINANSTLINANSTPIYAI